MTTDKFGNTSPFPSWILSDDGLWQPPVPHPEDGNKYFWSESAKGWEPYDKT